MRDVRIDAVVRGRVQGVGFRWFVQRSADALRVTGWVKNRADGSVQFVAEGSRESLEDLIAVVREGTSLSRVEDLTVEWYPGTGEFTSFRITF